MPIPKNTTLYAPALRAMEALLEKGSGPVIVAVDGRCASGKTTFAQVAGELFEDCNVFHMDDFFLPPAMRTPQRLSAPGGNVDYERAQAELFEPLRRGEPVAHRRFDCASITMGEPVAVPFRRLNLIEGSYAHHPELRGYASLCIFFTCSPEVQLSRLRRRESPGSLEKFRERWVPMEENYFGALQVEAQADLVIDTSELPTLEEG